MDAALLTTGQTVLSPLHKREAREEGETEAVRELSAVFKVTAQPRSYHCVQGHTTSLGSASSLLPPYSAAPLPQLCPCPPLLLFSPHPAPWVSRPASSCTGLQLFIECQMPRVAFTSSCRSVPFQVPGRVKNQNQRLEVRETNLGGRGGWGTWIMVNTNSNVISDLRCSDHAYAYPPIHPS